MSSPLTVQSRSLQNLQASRVLHIIESPLSADEESAPQHQYFPGDAGLGGITALMGKMGVNRDQPDLEAVSLNRSQEGTMGHFHMDPITGHIATVTLDPQRTTRLRPHADDM